MMVGSYDVRWDWDATQGLFLRSQLGSTHELTDGQASADSVVVLVMEYGESPAGGGPEAQTVGGGAAFVYTEGRRVEGTWSRRAPPTRSPCRPTASRSCSHRGAPGSSSSTPDNNLTDGLNPGGRPLPN